MDVQRAAHTLEELKDFYGWSPDCKEGRARTQARITHQGVITKDLYPERMENTCNLYVTGFEEGRH